MYNNITDFSILKFFSINTWPEKGSSTIQVIWRFPYVGLIKVNIHGVARDFLGVAACAGIFRGSIGE